MISYRLNFVGVQLLFLAYTAQSFVLLTANIDDIKKLARKFVSDSLADKLTDFVVKATEQMSDQMVDKDTSGKNSIKSHDISESNEYALRDIVKQSQEKQGKTTRREKQEYDSKIRNEERQKANYLTNESKELSIEREERLLDNEKKWNSKEISLERTEKREKSTTKNWRDKFVKSKESEHQMSTAAKNLWLLEKTTKTNKDLSSQERPNHESQYSKEEDKKKEYDHPNKQFQSYYKESHKDYEPKQYTKPTVSQTYFPTYKPPKSQKSEPKTPQERLPEFDNTPSIGSRYRKIKDRDSKMLTFDFKSPKSEKSIKHDERESSAEQSSLKYKKIKDQYFKMPVNHSNEFNNVKSDEKLWDLETTRFRGHSFNHGDSITTKKERTDFDQYDNRNYPKADFIATSGQMMLPRISPNIAEKSKPDLKSWWEKELKLPNATQLKSWLSKM